MKRFYKTLLAALLCMVTVMMTAQATSPSSTPESIPYDSTGYPNMQKIQSNLYAKGYYEGENYIPGKFDENTMNALRRFYENNGMVFDEENPDFDSLTGGIQLVILENEFPEWTGGKDRQEEAPSELHISKGSWEKSDYVLKIQKKLQNAGYFEEEYKQGYFDDATERALERFYAVMQINHGEEIIIDKALYDFIIDESPMPTPLPPAEKPVFPIEYKTTGEHVANLQNRLVKLGYLTAGTFISGTYDDRTHWAMQEFAFANELGDLENVCGESAYNTLMNEYALPKQKQAIQRGEKSDYIEDLRKRLNQLGCMKGLNENGNVYDEDMIEAVARFAKANGGIQFDKDNPILTVEMQERILSDDAASWKPNWFVDSVSVLGIGMPRYVVIILILAVLGGLAALMIKTFSKDKSAAPDTQVAPGASSVKIELEVRYRGAYVGSSTHVIGNMPVHIGRAYKEVPLNPSDRFIGKNHCQISYDKGKLYLRDFSKNGTQINGTALHNTENLLRNNDEIGLGEHTIKMTIIK